MKVPSPHKQLCNSPVPDNTGAVGSLGIFCPIFYLMQILTMPSLLPSEATSAASSILQALVLPVHTHHPAAEQAGTDVRSLKGGLG